MTSPRELLDDYASTEWCSCKLDPYTDGHETTVGQLAPKAIKALRAVLAECDFLDACIADYKGHEIAELIRGSITRALEDQ